MRPPNQWKVERFDELADVQEGQVSPKTPPYNLMPHVGADNIVSDGDLLSNLKTCEELGLISGKYPFRSGAIIYSKIRPNLNKVCRVHFEGVCSADAYPIYAKESRIDPDFLVWGMRGFLFVRQAVATSMRTGMPKINRDDLGNIEFLVPPIAEQKAIASILGAWAQALVTFDALIAAKERRKTALMQQLLTGKLRLKGFAGKWTMQRLGDLAEEVTIPNRGKLGTERLYAVTKADGMVPMREHVKGASLQRCNVVERDWFAYNPMRINIGSLARWQGSDPVMVSPDYVVFRCNPKVLLPGFLDHLRRAWRWQQFVGMAGDGSVRVRIYFDRLAEFASLCPPLAEQQAITAILDTCDEELRMLRAQRAALDQQKRGLMQRLLTGRVRLSV